MLSIRAITDTGLVRDNNEDFCLFEEEECIIIVADGVGGYAFGEIASSTAARTCFEYLMVHASKFPSAAADETAYYLKQAMVTANDRVMELKSTRTDYRKMGTTLSCLVIKNGRVDFATIGDSRVYLLDMQHREIFQLSRDHTLLQERLEKENPSNFSYQHKYSGNILTRMVGSKRSINPDCRTHKVFAGDIILTCTDGLSDLVSAKEIQTTILQYEQDFDQCLTQLVNLCKSRGARDNITIVLARVNE